MHILKEGGKEMGKSDHLGVATIMIYDATSTSS